MFSLLVTIDPVPSKIDVIVANALLDGKRVPRSVETDVVISA